MPAIIEFFQHNGTAIFAVLFFASEALDAIPAVHASSIWKLVYDFVKSKAGK